MCLRFVFLLITRVASGLRLSRREEMWKTAEILIMRHQLAVDPAVPPSGILAGQPTDQGLDVPPGRRPASPAAHGPGGPAEADDVTVPAHDRVRGNQQPQPLAPRFRYHAEQSREQCPVRPVQVRAARLPPLQDGELVAQDQDLCGLPRLLTPG